MTRQISVKRPLFVFCMSFFAAGILTAGVSLDLKLLLIPAGVLLIMSSLILLRGKARHTLALCSALLIVLPIWMSASFQYFTTDRSLESCNRYDGIKDTVRVTIEEVRYSSSYYGYYTARVRDGSKVPDMTVSLGIPDGSCKAGDVLYGEVVFRKLDSSASFDESTYFIPDGILMCAEGEEMTFEGVDSTESVFDVFKALNRKLTSRIRASSGGASLACAVLLGRADLLEASVKRDFGRIGISHLLAVSGIHLSIAVSALEFLLDKTRIRGKKKTLLLCLAVLFSMALVGFSKSVTRAGLMHLLRYSGQLLGRRSDGFTSLGAAAVIIILADPFAVYDTGFILSVLACYACLVYSRYTRQRTPMSNKLKSIIRGAADTVKLTLLITGLTLPVMWKVFGSLSLISPLTNVIFIPFVTLFMYFSLIYMVLCGIPAANTVLTPVLLAFEDLITALSEKLSLMRGIAVSLKGTAVGISAAAVFTSLLIATFIYKRRRVLSVISVGLCSVSLAVCLVFGYMANAESAEADFVTRGKSEGFSIRCGNSYVLIDVSDGSSGFSRELTFAAEDRGASEITSLILTHLHRRHISSVASLADNYILRLAVLPEGVTDSDTEVAEALCEIFDKRGIPYVFYSREDGTVNTADITFTSLGYTALSRSTHPVVGFSISLADKNLIYLGSSFGEKNDLPDGLSAADTVFLGAHPPVRKAPVSVFTEGKVILTHLANEKGLLTVNAESGVVTLDEDAVYSVGRYKK